MNYAQSFEKIATGVWSELEQALAQADDGAKQKLNGQLKAAMSEFAKLYGFGAVAAYDLPTMARLSHEYSVLLDAVEEKAIDALLPESKTICNYLLRTAGQGTLIDVCWVLYPCLWLLRRIIPMLTPEDAERQAKLDDLTKWLSVVQDETICGRKGDWLDQAMEMGNKTLSYAEAFVTAALQK